MAITLTDSAAERVRNYLDKRGKGCFFDVSEKFSSFHNRFLNYQLMI